MSAKNQQLQQKLTSLAETKKGRAETDWKRLESEKQVWINYINASRLHAHTLCDHRYSMTGVLHSVNPLNYLKGNCNKRPVSKRKHRTGTTYDFCFLLIH